MDFGIDYAFRRVAVACPEAGWARAFTVPKSDRGREVSQLAHWVGLQVPPGSRVFIESPIGGGSNNRQTLVGMAETEGALLGRLGADCELIKVAPSSWKKTVCDNGSLDKAGVAAWLAEHRPAASAACEGDQDRVDATCLGLVGEHQPAVARDGAVQRPAARRVLRAQRDAADVHARGRVRAPAVR